MALLLAQVYKTQCQENFQTIWKLSGWSANFTDWLEISDTKVYATKTIHALFVICHKQDRAPSRKILRAYLKVC